MRISRDRPSETFYWTRDVHENHGPWAVNIPDEFFNIEVALLGKEMGKTFTIKEGHITCTFQTYEPHFEAALRPVTMGVEGE